MLLRHTSAEVAERKALTINPAKTCQPIGAMYAALGVHRCLPHSHGSQGCCSYHRSTLTRHFKEPVMAGTSSFTEGASVFGGQSNLVQSIDNIFTIYDPDIIAVHTTCLSETIGDDVQQIINKADADGKIPENRHVIYANTPSYTGSHIDGFSNMVMGIIRGFAARTGAVTGNINIIPGWVEPGDMRELKRMAGMMEVPFTMLPDTSGVLDAPLTGKHHFYPDGGVTIDEITAAGDAMNTLALGSYTSEAGAGYLYTQCKVPYTVEDIPLGVSATDRFLMRLAAISGRTIPGDLELERGQLVDMISDMQQYLYRKKVALFGDPDQIIPLTEFLLDLGMLPVHIVSGTPGKEISMRLTNMLQERGVSGNVKNGAAADMFLLHQWIKNEPVDLLIGNTYGKYIARDEDIPFVRFGFPILDRAGHSYFPSVGYSGAMRLLEKILNVILDHQDREAPEESFELVM